MLGSKVMNTNEHAFKMATRKEDATEARENEHEKEDVKGESDAYYIDQTVRCARNCTQNCLKSLPLIKF